MTRTRVPSRTDQSLRKTKGLVSLNSGPAEAKRSPCGEKASKGEEGAGPESARTSAPFVVFQSLISRFALPLHAATNDPFGEIATDETEALLLHTKFGLSADVVTGTNPHKTKTPARSLFHPCIIEYQQF